MASIESANRKARVVTGHFADRLFGAIQDKGAAVCVGIDPVVDRLPEALRPEAGAPAPRGLEAVEAFSRAVIDVVAPIVPAVKINVAFFEPFGGAGLACYFDLIATARSRGLLVIGDVKRADVGHSAGRYAAAHLGGGDSTLADGQAADAITVNPYLGVDGIQPFVEAAAAGGRGLFVLVQTSNPSTVEVQQMRVSDGRSVEGEARSGGVVPDTVAEAMAARVDSWGGRSDLVGGCGYSLVGAVVAPFGDAGIGRLRGMMPRSVFLVPGFGAQGRGPVEVADCFDDQGRGAIIAASRSVIYAYRDSRTGAESTTKWTECVERACREFADSIARIQRRRR